MPTYLKNLITYAQNLNAAAVLAVVVRRAAIVEGHADRVVSDVTAFALRRRPEIVSR